MTLYQLVYRRVRRKVADLRRRGADIANPFDSFPKDASRSTQYRWLHRTMEWSATRHVVLGDGEVITEKRYREPLKVFSKRDRDARRYEKLVMGLPLPKGMKARRYDGSDFEPTAVKSVPLSMRQQLNREMAAKYVRFSMKAVVARNRSALLGMAAMVGDERVIESIKNASDAKLNAAVFRGGIFSMIEPYYPVEESGADYIVDGWDDTANEIVSLLS